MPFSRFVPSYLLSELRHVHFFHGYNTRSRDLLHPPFTKTAKYQESFIINGTQTFNTLSRNFRQVDFRQVGILDNFLRSSPRLNMATTMLNALCCFFFLLRFFIIAAFERWEDHLRIVGTMCCSIHQEFATFSLLWFISCYSSCEATVENCSTLLTSLRYLQMV